MEQTTITPETEVKTEVIQENNPYAAAPAAGENSGKNKKHTGLIVLAVIMCLLVASSTVMSTLSFVTVRFRGYGDWDYYYEEDVAQENDVTIAGEYTIKATTQISDAYISGDTSALSDRDKETLQMASDILDSIITDGMTDFDKEVAVYEWLTTKLQSDTGILTVIPTTGEDEDNPYGVLKYRNAVCVGYATTFRMFMQMLGIECMVCHDTGLGHSWDLVHLDDGWYHTDCYFDSPEGSFRHFNLSDSVCSQDHDWNMEFFPEANGTKYNYITYNCSTLKDIYEIPQWLSDGMEADKTLLSCKFENGVENEAAAQYMVQYVADLIGYTQEKYVDHYWTEDENGNYVLCMFIESYGTDYDYDLPDEEIEKIENAVNDVFDVGDFDFEYYEEEENYGEYCYTDEDVTVVNTETVIGGRG